MDLTNVLTLLLHGNQLKRTSRTGWGQRGIINAENVAAHSFGVAFITLILSQEIQTPFDLSRALAMALLHDLPEGLTSDIPKPAWRFLPDGIKVSVEQKAMTEILGGASSAEGLMDLWQELHRRESKAAQLVDDADKLDLYLQAVVYEEQHGNALLAEFWNASHQFYFAESQALYEELRARRIRGPVKESA